VQSKRATAFWEIGARPAFREITLPRTGLQH
jgi:hypothetical protein